MAKVITVKDIDVTENFIRGANEVLNFAKLMGIKVAYLKEKSPSCGVNFIYINNTLTKGSGVTTALLSENNIEVFGVDK